MQNCSKLFISNVSNLQIKRRRFNSVIISTSVKAATTPYIGYIIQLFQTPWKANSGVWDSWRTTLLEPVMVATFTAGIDCEIADGRVKCLVDFYVWEGYEKCSVMGKRKRNNTEDCQRNDRHINNETQRWHPGSEIYIFRSTQQWMQEKWRGPEQAILPYGLDSPHLFSHTVTQLSKSPDWQAIITPGYPLLHS